MENNDKDMVISALNDCFARCLLASAGNELILLDFVNAVTQNVPILASKKIKYFESLQIESPFDYKVNKQEREKIVDVKARANTGELIMIEIQLSGNITFISRILAYIASNYQTPLNYKNDQADKSKKEAEPIDYSLLKPVISISLLDIDLVKENKLLHTCYQLKEVTTGILLTDHIEIHLLELKKSQDGLSEKLKLWIIFFTAENLEEVREMLMKADPIFEKVFDCYDRFKGDPKLVQAYREAQAYMLTQKDTLKQERFEGREEGEYNKAIKMAKNMLLDNEPIDKIIRYTELSIEQIKDLL